MVSLYRKVTDPPALGWTYQGVVIELGGPGSFDEVNAESPNVVKIPEGVYIQDTTYYYVMMYRGHAANDAQEIGRAYSVDGVTWVKDPGNPRIPINLAWEGSKISPSGLVYEGGGSMKIWYEGGGGAGVGLATSSDYGYNWTKDQTNPVLDKGPSTWDDWGVGEGDVRKIGGQYVTMYKGYGSGEPPGAQFGLATSLDGVSWTKDSENPVIIGDVSIGEADDLRAVHFLPLDEKYLATYSDSILKELTMATCPDESPGLHSWMKNGVIMEKGGHTWDENWVTAGCPMIEGSTFKVWYEVGGDDGKCRIAYAYIGLDTIRERSSDCVGCDPKVTLLELLEGGWSLGYEPTFSADWLQEKAEFPQVVVSHVLTTPRPVGFSEDPAAAQRRFEAVYFVDVWAKGDAEQRWELLGEVDSILHSKCNSPGGGLEYLEVSAWRDLDEGNLRPLLFRSQTRVEVLYYG